MKIERSPSSVRFLLFKRSVSVLLNLLRLRKPPTKISPSDVRARTIHEIHIVTNPTSFDYTKHKLSADYGEFVSSASDEDFQTGKVLDLKEFLFIADGEINENMKDRPLYFKLNRGAEDILNYHIAEGMEPPAAIMTASQHIAEMAARMCAFVQQYWEYVSVAAVAHVSIVTADYRKLDFLIATEAIDGIETTPEFMAEGENQQISKLNEILDYLGFNTDEVRKAMS